MAINLVDTLLHVGGEFTDWDAKKQQEQLEDRFKELQDNKELYRALATTRYSKDLDKYYKETEKYENLQDVYKQIQSANGGRGMGKRQAALMIIGATPQLAFTYKNAKDEDAQNAIIASVSTGFKDTYKDETIMAAPGEAKETKKVNDGFTFTHSGLELTAPKQEDYFQTPDYWGNLAKEIRAKETGPLQKQILKLMGKEPAEVDLDNLEQKASTTIRKDIDSVPYTSKNTDKDIAGMITNPDGTAFENSSKALSVLNTKYQTYAGEATDSTKKSIIAAINAMSAEKVKGIYENDKGEIIITDEGQTAFNQARFIYNNVVNDLYFNIVKIGGKYEGQDNIFTDENIQRQYLSEMRKRTFTLNNKHWSGSIGLDTGDVKGVFVLPTEVLKIGEELSLDTRDALQEHLNTVFKDVEGTLNDLYPNLINESKKFLGLSENKKEDKIVTNGKLIATESIIKDTMTKNGGTQSDAIEFLEENGYDVSDELKNKVLTIDETEDIMKDFIPG